MKKYEVETVQSYLEDVRYINEVIKCRETNGWTFVPPMLLQPDTDTSIPNFAHFILTFEKED